MHQSKPIYTSTTMQGLALSAAAVVLPALLSKAGITDPGAQQSAIAGAFQIGGLLLAGFGRLKANKRIG